MCVTMIAVNSHRTLKLQLVKIVAGAQIKLTNQHGVCGLAVPVPPPGQPMAAGIPSNQTLNT